MYVYRIFNLFVSNSLLIDILHFMEMILIKYFYFISLWIQVDVDGRLKAAPKSTKHQCSNTQTPMLFQ